MLKRRNRGVRVVGGLALVSVTLLVLLIPFNEGVSTQGLGDDFDVVFEFEDLCDQSIPAGNETSDTSACIELEEQSVLPPQPIIADSNDGFVQQFLNELRLSDTKALGIETVAVKFDVAGNTQTSISILPIPLGSFEPDVEGFFVDRIQIRFFGISQADVTALNLEGTVEFLLDDIKVATKRLWSSESVINQNVIPLKIVNFVPPPFDDRPETFDFTFSDEGFVDGSTHVFRVIFRDISGTLNGNVFDFSGEFIAYELVLTVDESKIIIVDEKGDLVPVLKSDSTLTVCAGGERQVYKITSLKPFKASQKILPAVTTPFAIKILNSDETLIDMINTFTSTANNVEPSKTTPTKYQCKAITGLQRGTDYIIHLSGIGLDIPISLPLSQHNINLQFTTLCLSKCISDGGIKSVSTYTHGVSNFGFTYSDRLTMCDRDGIPLDQFKIFKQKQLKVKVGFPLELPHHSR